MGLLLAAIVLGLTPAFIARGKGRSFIQWWVYGALLFIVALPHSLLLEPQEEMLDLRRSARGMKRCPYCLEFVRQDAQTCRHCNRDLVQATPPTSQGST